MKKSIVTAILVSVFSVGMLFAQETATAPSSKAPAAKPAKAVSAQSVEGTIASVSNEQIVITAAGGKSDTLDVTTATMVKKAGKAAKVMELAVGDSVKVTFKKKAGKMVATRIMEKTMPAAR